MTYRTNLALALAAGATFFFASPDRAGAATSASITYTATGTFASTPTSGSDTLRLAGEPFTVAISVVASTPPSQTGKNWALYTKLKMTGTVHSGLLGPSPIQIASGGASIQQLINPGQYDLFLMGAPIKVVGISLTIRANITLPNNTLSNPLLHPFSAVTLAPANATLTYSDGGASTVLAIQSGSLTATAPFAATGAVLKAANLLRHPYLPDPMPGMFSRRIDYSIWI